MVGRRVAPVVAVGLVGLGVGAVVRPGPVAEAGGPPAARPLRAGYVSMAEFMRKSRRWQAHAAAMRAAGDREGRRVAAAKAGADAARARAAAAPPDLRADLDRDAVAAERAAEDADRAARAGLDRRAAAALAVIHREFAGVIADLARERGLDAVHACPARLDRRPDEMPEGQYIDMYFRPPAMSPLFLADGLDLTPDVVARVNKAFDADQAAEDEEVVGK